MKLKVNKNGELLDYLYNNLDMPKKKIKQYLTTAQLYDKKIPAMMKVQKLLKYFWEVCK